MMSNDHAESPLPHPRLHGDLLGARAALVRHPIDHLLERHLVLDGRDQFHGDRIREVLHNELLLPDALQAQGGGVHGRMGVESDRVVDVPDIPKRHSAFAKGLPCSLAHRY